MDEQQKRIYKRVAQIKADKKTYICFEFRYLLEGRDIALSRDFENTVYYGERITDYGQVPSPYILINESVGSKTLEGLFSDNKIDGFEDDKTAQNEENIVKINHQRGENNCPK